jgi:large subunit ribosomal protein L25
MSKMPQVKVDKRQITGRKVKLLRRQGKVLGNVFGKKITSIAIQMDSPDFTKLYHEVGETTLLDLQITGEAKSRPVLIANIQRHPVTNQIIHVDFHQVDLAEKVTANVPLEFLGESPAVKEQGGILVHVVTEIEVEALPAELPDKFIVDISKLANLGDSLTLKELNLDRSKVTIDLADDTTIVTIQSPKEEEVVEAPAVPAEGEAAPAPAEGEAAPAGEAKPSEAPDNKPET